MAILFTGIFTVPTPPSHTFMPGEPFDKYAASDRDFVINSLGFRLIMGGAATIIVYAILHYRLVSRAEEFEAVRIMPRAAVAAVAEPIRNSTAITMPSTIEKPVSATVPQAISATAPVLPESIGPSITTYKLRSYPNQLSAP